MTGEQIRAANEPGDHFCPGCGKRLSYGPRTPWYFCGNCTSRATDARGWPITFIGLGAEWAYAEGYGPDAHDRGATAVMCLINGRPSIVHEARQGGVVAQPLYKEHSQHFMSSASDSGSDWRRRGVVDLTDIGSLDEVVAARLTHKGRRLRY